MNKRILIVDDDPELRGLLRGYLGDNGFEVDAAEDGAAMRSKMAAAAPDLVILDLMLPGEDGLSLCRALRAGSASLPILMLTARGEDTDRIVGLEMGADDYLPKPFELQILLARLRGLLRRREWLQKPHEHDTLTFAGKRLDLEALELHVGDQAYQLTQMECDLLQYLMKNAGKAVSRRAILEEVWDLREDTDTRAIDNFIVRLRRYLEEDPTKPKHLITVRGVGYKFVQ